MGEEYVKRLFLRVKRLEDDMRMLKNMRAAILQVLREEEKNIEDRMGSVVGQDAYERLWMMRKRVKSLISRLEEER
ncbi:MAG: hypothetical protein QW334_00340 [Thermofilum sp.]